MEAPLIHLALVGTPNSGKTSLFNALTGSRQKVANYPGVTVERKEGSFVTPAGRQVSVVDLSGTYSLRGRSPDEEITRDMVLGRTPGETLPDLVLCVADSTNLRLTIRLLLELKRTGRPLMLVLNMFDIATRRGVSVEVARLSEALGVPVVTSIAVRTGGIAELLRPNDESWRRRRCHLRKISGSPSPSPSCGRPSARPIASSLPLSACRQGPTTGRRGSTPWCCIRWQGWRSWP
jgi:ferrous iron transport protein B